MPQLQPPKLARKFLQWHCDSELLEEIEGDLNEEFEALLSDKGKFRARLFYLIEVLRFMRMYKPRKRIKTLNQLDMLLNYFKMACRNLLKNRAYTAINLSGLVIGITCSFLIFLYVRAELSFDGFHSKADQIYRLQHVYGFMNAPIGPAYKAAYPEVEDYVRVYPWLDNTRVVLPDQKEFYDELYIADENFFEVFDFQFLSGNRAQCLSGPNQVVLTESMAIKYFGSADALGKTLTIEGMRQGDLPVLVSAVIADLPFNSHLQFDLMLSWQVLENDPTLRIRDSWINDWVGVYLVIEPEADIDQLASVAYKQLWNTTTGTDPFDSLRIMPLKQLHLNSAYLDADYTSNGDINQVRIFGAIAFIILLIACINFMNLATARSSRRSKEVGVRKVMGAYRQQLVTQFLAESFLITCLGALLSCGLIYLLIPMLEGMTELRFSSMFSNAWDVVLPFLLIVFFTALLAGAYPAFVLSAFHPASVLKGKQGGTAKTALLRKGLVVFQFAVSVMLILGAIVAYHQMSFVRNKSLGFQPSQVIAMTYGSPGAMQDKWTFIKGELSAVPSVTDVFASRMIPGDEAYSWGYKFDGYAEDANGDGWMGYYLGPGAIEGFGMELIMGRDFSESIPSDSNAWILNESAWKEAIEKYGEDWRNPLGKKIEYFTTNSGDWRMDKSGKVIGVVRDFHHHSLKEPIESLVIHNAPSSRVLVRVEPGTVQTTLQALASIWEGLGSESPFNYELVDQSFDQLYAQEEQFSQLILIFCALAIFVACLGLLGLASFTAEMRIKEIGVRKVLGANVSGILWLLSASFLRLIVLAMFIALPLGYFMVNRWLDNFQYRIAVEWPYFLYAVMATTVIALLTVGYHSVKAAIDNPVKSLRHE